MNLVMKNIFKRLSENIRHYNKVNLLRNQFQNLIFVLSKQKAFGTVTGLKFKLGN